MIKVIERKRLKFKSDYTYLNRNMVLEEHPPHIHESLLSYFKKEDLHQYPDMWKTYDVLSKYLSVPEGQILVTRGVEGSFKCIYETILQKGDTVGVLTPTCAMYHVYSKVYGIEEIEIKGKSPDYNITVEQIKKIVPKIKVLFLDNPKSHIPNSFNKDELKEIIDYCEKHKVIVFLDEVYIGWELKSYLPNLSKHKNLVISQSFSKIAFPSIKSGWLVTSKELQKQIASTRNSYELDYFACKGIEFLIDNQDYINNLKKEMLDIKNMWYDKFKKISGFKVYNSKGYTLRLYSKDTIHTKKIYDNLYKKKVVTNLLDDKNLVFSVTKNKEVMETILNEILKEERMISNKITLENFFKDNPNIKVEYVKDFDVKYLLEQLPPSLDRPPMGKKNQNEFTFKTKRGSNIHEEMKWIVQNFFENGLLDPLGGEAYRDEKDDIHFQLHPGQTRLFCIRLFGLKSVPLILMSKKDDNISFGGTEIQTLDDILKLDFVENYEKRKFNNWKILWIPKSNDWERGVSVIGDGPPESPTSKDKFHFRHEDFPEGKREKYQEDFKSYDKNKGYYELISHSKPFMIYVGTDEKSPASSNLSIINRINTEEIGFPAFPHHVKCKYIKPSEKAMIPKWNNNRGVALYLDENFYWKTNKCEPGYTYLWELFYFGHLKKAMCVKEDDKKRLLNKLPSFLNKKKYFKQKDGIIFFNCEHAYWKDNSYNHIDFENIKSDYIGLLPKHLGVKNDEY